MKIGERLKEERKRLGLNQADFAALLGASKTSQFNYEKGDRSPDAIFLAAAAEQGVDVLYVVTGVRAEQAAFGLDDHEAELLNAFRNMPKQQQEAFLLLSSSIASSSGNSPLVDKP